MLVPAWALGSGRGSGAHAGVADAYDASSKTCWHVELDHGAPAAEVRLAHSDVSAYITGAGQGGDDVVHRSTIRRYLDVSPTGPAWYTTDPRVSPTLARWHARAHTNGGLAGTYGRIGPHGRSHCSCAAVTETAARVYLRCPKYSVQHIAPRSPCCRRRLV